jgi:hypothetical protein
MPWAIERGGAWHSPGGWKNSHEAATRFDTPEDAEEARKELNATTLAGLPGELHVRELPA